MSRIRYVAVAAILVGTLWAQNSAPPGAPNFGAPTQPTSQSKQPETSAPAVPNATSPIQPNANPGPTHPSAALPSPSAPDSTVLLVTKRVKAAYPIEAQLEKLQGEVVLKIVVSETGDVESAEVVSGHPVLAKAAVDAVKKWKVQPFIRNSKKYSE